MPRIGGEECVGHRGFESRSFHKDSMRQLYKDRAKGRRVTTVEVRKC